MELWAQVDRRHGSRVFPCLRWVSHHPHGHLPCALARPPMPSAALCSPRGAPTCGVYPVTRGGAPCVIVEEGVQGSPGADSCLHARV